MVHIKQRYKPKNTRRKNALCSPNKEKLRSGGFIESSDYAARITAFLGLNIVAIVKILSLSA